MISPLLRKTLVSAFVLLLMAVPVACTPQEDGNDASLGNEAKPEEAKEEGAAEKPGGPPPALVVVTHGLSAFAVNVRRIRRAAESK